jgi:ankyrin repeat protein
MPSGMCDSKETKPTSPHTRLHNGEKLSGNNDKSNDMIPELRQGPLALAALTGNLHLVESILDRGVDPNFKNRKGQTALFFAVQRVEDWNSQAELESEKEAVVRLLLQKGALVNSLDIHGDSVLALALKARYRKLAKVLLEAGADLPSGVIDGAREPFWSSFDQG